MSQKTPKPSALGTGFLRGAADALTKHNKRTRMMIELDGEQAPATEEEQKKKKKSPS